MLLSRPSNAIQVVIRVRPPLRRELEGYQPFQNTALIDAGQRILTVSENLQSIQHGGANGADAGLVSGHTSARLITIEAPCILIRCHGSARAQAYATYRFTFDRVYGPDADQHEVYEQSAKRTVLSTLQVRASVDTAQRSCSLQGHLYPVAMRGHLYLCHLSTAMWHACV